VLGDRLGQPETQRFTSNEAKHEPGASEQIPVSSLLDVGFLFRADVLLYGGKVDDEKEDGEGEAEESDSEVDVLHRCEAIILRSRED
jgi:hypothetical protein